MELPEELLYHVAGFLSRNQASGSIKRYLERGPFPTVPDDVLQRRKDAEDPLAVLRLVSTEWRRAASPWLFATLRIARVERLEFFLENPSLTAHVRHLELLVAPLMDYASRSETMWSEGMVLKGLVGQMPALAELLVQGPLSEVLCTAILLQSSTRRPSCSVPLLTTLGLVIQPTKHDDPDFLVGARFPAPISRILPFLLAHTSLRSLHIVGHDMAEVGDLAPLLQEMYNASIRLEDLSLDLLEEALADGNPLAVRLASAAAICQAMPSLKRLRFCRSFQVPEVSINDLSVLYDLGRLRGLNLGLEVDGSTEELQALLNRQGLESWIMGSASSDHNDGPSP